MTKEEIEDYLYFFLAPLLKANTVGDADMDSFQQMIILTLSQASVYIEAPGYTANTSSREFSNEIINEISDLSDKIFANIPDRTTDDSYWLKITVSALLAADISAGDTYLQAEKSFGSFSIDEEKSISFDFYYVAHQLQLRLPTTAEISAIISTKKPVTVADGAVTNIDIAECTLWLSAIHFDASVADATFYLGVRLKKCNISFDSGYTKSGNRISADLFVNFAKFVITCIPENEIPDGLGSTVAAGNTVVYPDKFVFTFQHRPGLPQPPKITLTHAEPFSSTLFGSAVNTISATDISSNWIADKKLLSFPLQVEDDVFAATENASPVFNLKGNGKIANPAWYFSVVSTNHPLGFGRLGIGSESGYIGFDIAEEFSLAWNGLQNAAIKLKDFFIRTSPDTLFINYTYDASMLAKQQLKLWPANEKKKGRSAIELNYAIGGTGSFTSHRKSIELHRTQAGIDVNIDRPVLSNGDRIFLKTTGGLMLINNKGVMTALVSGGPMDPSVAFENNAFKQLRSFALSNALIVVKPIEIFFLIGKLNAAGIAVSGQSIITFPVSYIEHTLPDPYITSLFNDQPIRDNNVNPTQSLMATVRWNETDDAELIMQLTDENGNVFTPKSTMTDDRLAEILLDFPLRHPGEAMYENSLRDAMASKGIAAVFFPDELPYSKYKPLYHSNINAAGAFSALHILPGNVSLVDLSGSASQMGIAFYRRLDNTENRIDAVLENTGYTINQMFRIANNELVSSGRFVRAFTLPHVQWEPVYFEEKSDGQISFDENDPYPTHGVPTRISSANKTDVTLAPLPVTKYIIEGFKDDKNKYAAAAHFALPFGMNAVALFHPFVAGADAFAEIDIFGAEIINPDSFSFSILNFNQPAFNFKKEVLSGAIQIKATSEGYPNASRDKRPDPSFHGAVLQAPNQFNEVGIVPREDGKLIIQYKDDSILGDIITKQFNKEMWGEYISSEDLTTLNFNRSTTAKVPLRRIDFSGLGASIFSNWFDKTADAGAVSQVKFNILIGRVAHEVVQIKSSIVPFFVPVVRTIIIERKNHGNVIRKDSGWVATGPGVFHHGYACHPGVVKGVYNVTSIKDREISIPQKLAKPGADGNDVIVDMAGVYYDADVLIENVVSGFKNTIDPVENNHKLVPSKKQFGYIILGNNASKSLEEYYTDEDLKNFMSSSDVGSLGGPVDCVLNIAGSDQFMHLTRVDVTIAATAKASVAAARGTLQLPKGGSWSVVKKVTNGVTSSLRNDETVPLIRNGILKLEAKTQKFLGIDFNGSLHVLGNPLNIDKYEAGKSALADIEYALLQSTDTQKLLFPRPSFTQDEKKVLVTDPLIADPYSLLKSNTIFPDSTDALTLGNTKGLVKFLDIQKSMDVFSFPNDVAEKLKNFVPLECIPVSDISRKLYLVKEDSFKIFIDYGIIKPPGKPTTGKQVFTAALNAVADDASRWQMINKEVAIVVELGDFKPLITVKGDFTAEPGAKPKFDNAKIIWNEDIEAIKKIIEVLSILSMLSKEGDASDIIKDGFSFVMGNSPDSWSYECTIEEKIPVIKFPNPVQLAQLPGPAPLIIEAGLDLGVFFNLSLSTNPNNLIKAGAGVVLGFEATIQVLIISIEGVSAYGVGTAKVEIFIELQEAKPTFKFTMGFGATVAVQLPMVGYVSLTRVISLGASIDSNGMEMTVGQMLRGVITVGGGLASVSLQVEASGTVSNKGKKDPPDTQWTAIVRGVFTLDVTVGFIFSWDFSKPFEHEVNLPNPF